MPSPVLKPFISSISFHLCDIPIKQCHDYSHFTFKQNKAQSSHKYTLLGCMLNKDLQQINNYTKLKKVYLIVSVTNRIEIHLRNINSFPISFHLEFVPTIQIILVIKVRGLIY